MNALAGDMQALFGEVFGAEFLDATLKTIVSQYDTGGDITEVPTNTSIKLQKSSFSAQEMTKYGVTRENVKFVVLQHGIDAMPDTDARIVFQEEEYSCSKLDEDTAAVSWIMSGTKRNQASG